MIGTLLAKRYSIESILGEGGMGVVYKAHDTLLDRPVAIKAVSAAMLGDEGARRLLREAQSAAKLTHPNIVGIYDVLEDSDQRLIVMEYVEGQTIRERIPMPWQDAVEIALRICDALGYAHEHGIVHRDIKPENMLTTPGGGVKVMDFGLARSEGRSRMTQSGMLVGTVAYMAPEQALSGTVDARSDLYSLGCVLYEAITGKAPFVADDPIAIISMHVNVPPVSPRFHTPDLPTLLEAAILRLLAKDPTERYQSAAGLADVLRSTLLPLDAEQEGASVIAAALPAVSLFDLMVRGRLIDREPELGELKSALESMLSARGQVVLIAGEPGIGKTRLAEELLVYARLRGCLALTGRCYEQEVAIPYLPVAEVLQAAVRSLAAERLEEALGPHAPEIVKLVPELATRVARLEPSPPLEPNQERLRLYESVRSFLATLAHRQPLVVLFDDLHWADAGTLQLLRHVARGLRAERLLVVGTYRDVEVDRAHPLSTVLAEMNRERLHRRVLVRGLAPEHVSAMIQATFQTQNPVSDEMRDLVYRETEGNPFFVEEVLKHLVETGAIYRGDGGWERKAIEELDVPQSVREVIGRRLERVSEPCRRALTVASVIGRRFTFEVLQQAEGVREEDLLDALEEAEKAQIVREQASGRESEYEFGHALIREVLYDGLAHRRRRGHHQKVGEAIEVVYGARLDDVVEELAHHFTQSQTADAEKAITYSLQAAEKSIGLFAYEEAVRFYRNALDLLEEKGDEPRGAEVYAALGLPFTYLDKTDEAVRAYERALAFYDQNGNRREAARLHLLIGHALQYSWDFSGALPHLKEALAGLDPVAQREDVLLAHVDLARAHAFLRDLEAAARHATEGIRIAGEIGHRSREAHALATLGLVAHRHGRKEEAKELYRRAIVAGRTTRDPEGRAALGRALNNLALISFEEGNHEEALALNREALDAAKRTRDIEGIVFHNAQVSFVYFMWGDWKRARERLLDSLQRPLSPTNRRLSEARLKWLEGEWEAALALMQELADERNPFPQWTFGINGQAAWQALDLDRVEDAAAAAERAATAIDEDPTYTGWPPFLAVAEALGRAGRRERCEQVCAAAEGQGERTGARLAVIGSAVGRAALALYDGEADRAVELLQGVLPSVDWAPVVRARFLRRLGWALKARDAEGDRHQAQQALGECLQLLERMGDRRMAGLVRTELELLDR
ncbi:MAG: protein kinase domain-containing protein [bacterium]